MGGRQFAARIPRNSLRALAGVKSDDWMCLSFLRDGPVGDGRPDPNRNGLRSALNGQGERFVWVGIHVLIDRVDVIDLLVVERDDLVATLQLSNVRGTILDYAGNAQTARLHGDVKGAPIADDRQRKRLPAMLLCPFRYLFDIINFLAADLDNLIVCLKAGSGGFRLGSHFSDDRGNRGLQPNLAQRLALPSGRFRFFEPGIDGQDLIDSLNLKRNHRTLAADHIPANAVHHPGESRDWVAVDFHNLVTGFETSLSRWHIRSNVANDGGR